MLDEIEGRNGTESTDQPEGSGMQKGSLVEKNQGNLFGKKGKKPVQVLQVCWDLFYRIVCVQLQSVFHLFIRDSLTQLCNANSLSLIGESPAGTTSHFNPMFEDPVEGVVTLSTDILDP
ncbi:hypothetical protein GOBAR_DD27507 [Gossypium barbadense]|nr:hypothetical protein GOBAR_DD27507 [Gossypium barbadense]